MLEKGMLNNMETPAPGGKDKNANYLQQVRHHDSTLDEESQVSPISKCPLLYDANPSLFDNLPYQAPQPS